jgi:hypothetical protein
VSGPRFRRDRVGFMIRGAVLALAVACLAGYGARAERAPSADLSFRVLLNPDSVTVGDPIRITMEASGPQSAVLELPQLADSLGPFAVLSADPPVTSSRDGKIQVRQTGTLTLFRTGDQTLPELALLWVRGPGDTLAAWSRPLTVKVRSVLKPGEASLKNLRGLKGVVPLSKPRWWIFALIALAVAAAGLALWRYRGRLRRRHPAAAMAAPPPLPPEVAFERALESLYRRQLPEKGLVKEFYAEVSLLFRRYLEDRFGFPAVEETRTEVLESAARQAELSAGERSSLRQLLDEGDLVKFAKMERLLAEAREHAERARSWVRATARREAPVKSETAAPAGTAAPPAPASPVLAGKPGEERP